MDDEYDGYEDVGRSLDALIDAADGSNIAGSSSDADHAERLEQLRQFLEVSDPSAHDDGPPPTLLESRNDLQVEVEVEGVGLAVPVTRFAILRSIPANGRFFRRCFPSSATNRCWAITSG